MTPAERQRKWNRLRKLAATALFDGVAPNPAQVQYAAEVAHLKLRKKQNEVEQLSRDLLEDSEGSQPRGLGSTETTPPDPEASP